MCFGYEPWSRRWNFSSTFHRSTASSVPSTMWAWAISAWDIPPPPCPAARPSGEAGHGAVQRSNGKTLYILDELITGLHARYYDRLLRCCTGWWTPGTRLWSLSHNLDVIKTVDYPSSTRGSGGGDRGGEVVAVGTPEELGLSRLLHRSVFKERSWRRIAPNQNLNVEMPPGKIIISCFLKEGSG